MGIDVGDPDDMAAVVSKVMATLVDTVRDRGTELSEGAAGRLAGRQAERTRPVPVAPLATLDAADAAGAAVVRWRRGLIATITDAGARVVLRLPDRTISFPASCAPAVRALHSGAVADADTLPGLDRDDATVLLRRLLREAVVVPRSAADGRRVGRR